MTCWDTHIMENIPQREINMVSIMVMLPMQKRRSFYDFAVQGYDLTFLYKGKRYYFLSTPDHVALCDECYTEEFQVFPDGNAALEQFKIDGKSLLELIDLLEEVEPV